MLSNKGLGKPQLDLALRLVIVECGLGFLLFGFSD